MRAEAKTTRLVIVLGCLYFGLVPFLPIRTISIGPVNLLTGLAVATAAALFIVPCRKRVWSTTGWSIASALLLFSWTIGLMRAPEFAKQSAILWSLRFAVPWLLLSLAPLDRRYLRLLCASWFAGLCLTAAWQYFATDLSGLTVDAYSQHSYSRMLEYGEEWRTITQLGVYNTYGCMAMSIVAACALALALTSERKQERVVLGIGACLLFYSAWRGRFINSDLLAFMGILLATGLAAVATKMKFKHVLLILATLITGAVVGISITDLDTNVVWNRLITIADSGLEGDSSASSRISMMSLSLSAWLSNPLFGIGAMGWTLDNPGLYIGGHSSLVDIPAQIGILGLAGYYGLMLFPLRRAIVCFRKTGYDQDDRRTAMLVIIGTTLVFAGSILNPIFMMALISETLLLLVALGATLPQKLPGRMGNSSRGPWAAHRRPACVPANRETRASA